MFETVRPQHESQLQDIRDAGLYKSERILGSPQKVRVDLPAEKGVLNLCANNYLGLANHPDIIQAAHDALDRWGYGLSSVRFICGTQEIHKQLERRLSESLGMEDTILYSSCIDANGRLFAGRYTHLIGQIELGQRFFLYVPVPNVRRCIEPFTHEGTHFALLSGDNLFTIAVIRSNNAHSRVRRRSRGRER